MGNLTPTFQSRKTSLVRAISFSCSYLLVPYRDKALGLQVENMTNKHHIYMTKDGRISLAGLPSSKAEYLAKAIDDSVRNVKSKL